MRKKINQLNKNQSIVISCYRYAPESIRAFIRVENPHNPNVPAYYSFDEKKEADILRVVREQGYNFVCGKHKEVYDAIKQAIRKHNSRQLYFTYGFKLVDDERNFVYCKDACFFEKIGVNLEAKKTLFDRAKKLFSDKKWRHESYTNADLGAGYQIEKVTKHFQEINPLKLCKIFSY